jgi:penicillin-binding protein 1A
MPRKKPAKKRKNRTSYDDDGSLFGRLVKWLFVAGLWAGIIGTCVVAWYAGELPAITRAVSFDRKTSITVKAMDGSVIARYGEIRGDSITVDDLPPHLIYAVLATEDRRFYSHFGIDPLGLARAIVVNISKGGAFQGGSTITQQLAKNLFLSRERTLKRKIQEALLAFWLEHELTKDEILSAYLNRVYLGSGTYGVDAAARLYFGKPVQNINLREAALLAGLLKAPSRYSPLQNPELSRQRTNVVLRAMADAGYITGTEAKSLNEDAAEISAKARTANSMRYYTDWVVDGLDDLIGTPEEDLIIHTTLNPKIQKSAEDALTGVITENGEEKQISQGAVIVMRPEGSVVAMVGGADYSKSQFNRAVQAKRQPGSSFKPVVYLTALQYGFQPDSIVVDEPIREGRYRPQNYDGQYLGEVRLYEALALSLNTVSFRLVREMGPQPVIANARALGIYSKLEPDLSIALGTSSISPLELTTAYATLASGGVAVYPYAITKITNKDGDLYYQRPARRTSRRVLEEGPIRELAYMMRGVLEFGTGRGANPGFSAAGKTGTSQESRDAWFAGFTDEVVGVVWLGNDDNTPMAHVTGGSYPATIWRQVMQASRGQYAPFARQDISFSTFQELLGRVLTGNEHSGTDQNHNDYRTPDYSRDYAPPPGTGEYNN